MARRVFFSFHYDRDIFRVSQVRNSFITKGSYEESGYIDHADWETLERKGDNAVKQWINTQLEGASVTVVLIGSETSLRRWVIYEIIQSYNESKGLLGIYVHRMKDPNTLRGDVQGANPFAGIYVSGSKPPLYLSSIYPTYDWVLDNGFANFGSWVEKAAKIAGR